MPKLKNFHKYFLKCEWTRNLLKYFVDMRIEQHPVGGGRVLGFDGYGTV